MTHIFKKFIGIILLLATGIGYASCPNPSAPPGYTTSSVSILGVVFSVCYPSTVYLNANDGEFTTYISLNNTAGTPAAQLSLAGFAQPNSLPFTLISSTTCTPTAPPSDCGNNTVPSGGFGTDGVGEVDYINAVTLPANTNSTFSVTFKATATGIVSWTPKAIVGAAGPDALNTITINVLATCPTITASNSMGATACSNASSPTGSLSNFVAGGTPPYTFFTAGSVNGTVSANSAGVYSFTPNVAGPATGSFNYQAFDTFDCPSNTGTISVPIVNSPTNSGEVLYTTTFGTPVTEHLNFSGGTAPYTFTTLNIVNGNVAYNDTTGDFTFTQTAPGASYLQYSVTDANGCIISTPPILFIYSCNAGYTAAATLVNNVIYALCYPSTVMLGNPFSITTSIINVSPTLTTNTAPFSDIVPSSQPGYDPGLAYISNTPAPPGTTFNPTTTSSLNFGGMGEFDVAGNTIAPSTMYQVTQTILPTLAGPQTYTSAVVSNPSTILPAVVIEVLSCPSITGANTGITSCNNTVTGSLDSLVIGGSGPYTFFETGPLTCGDVTIFPDGTFVYTGPAGFTGPCSFEYFALDSDGCPSSTGVVTITANQGPIAEDGAGFTCQNVDFDGILSVTAGTPPYNFSIVTNGALGTATITDSVAGTFTYVPNNPDNFGADSFTFQVTDSAGCVSNVAAFGILIRENPITSPTGLSDCLNTTLTGSLSTLVSAGTPPYSFSLNGIPVGGTAMVSSTGIYSFSPTVGYSGPASFDYSVLDSAGCSATGAVDITVGSPIVSPSGLASCTDVAISGDLASLVSSGFPPYTFGPTGTDVGGAVTVSSTGLYDFTPTPGFVGTASFGYEVTDSAGCIGTGSIDITYAAPIASAGFGSTCENSTSFAGTLTATGGTLPYTFAIVTNGSLGTATIINTATGAFTYTPGHDTFGIDSFTFHVTDASGCVSNIAVFQITITQTPITSPTGINDCVNTPVNGNLTALVTAGTPPYSFLQTGASVGGTVTIGASGPYTFVPTAGFSGLGLFGYSVTDTAGCSATGAVDITISSPIAGSTSALDCVNTEVAGDLSGLVTSGFPPYIFGLTGTTVGGVATVGAGGLYTFVPTPGFSGPASFVYEAIDLEGCIATGAVDLTISSPIIASTGFNLCTDVSASGSLDELVSSGFPPYVFGLVGGIGGIATVSSTGIYSFVSTPGFSGQGGFVYNVIDSHGCVGTGAVNLTISQPIAGSTAVLDCVDTAIVGSVADLVTSGFPPYTFGLTGLPVGGTATVSSTGAYLFTPTAGFSGPAGFEYAVVDTNGCIATGAVDITVSSPIASPTAVNACLNTPVTGDLVGLVISGFPPYIFGLTGLPVGGVATVSATGLYNFIPTAGFSGPGGFVYEVIDSNGCIATAPVDVAVDSLVGNNASLVSCTDSYASSLLNFVTGGTGALTFSGPLSISCGAVTISPTGQFAYTAPIGFSGPCDFVYQVVDGIGCSATGAITVTANTAPTVSDGTLSTCQGVAVSDSLAGLLNEMPQPPLTFIIVTAPTHGTLTSFNASTGAYTYTPNAGFSGMDSFQFQVADSSIPPCTSNIGTVTITVYPAPVANGGSNITCKNETISGSVIDFVSSGTPPYTFAQIGTAVNGTVTLATNGDYTFVPTPNFVGLGTFQYQVTDANGCVSNVGTFTIDIILCCPVSDNPVMIDILEQYWGMTGL